MDDVDDPVVQEWSCYVDAIDETHVYLMMADMTTDQGDEREYGSFPIRLFDHIDVLPGLFLKVTVSAGRGIVIETVPRDPNARNEGAVLAELLSCLSQLRDEHDEITGA